MRLKEAEKKKRAKIVLKILNKTYPKISVPLHSRNVFTLLISVLLSAQCTDVNVNNVTKDIYPKYHKPKHFVKLGRKKIEKLIAIKITTGAIHCNHDCRHGLRPSINNIQRHPHTCKQNYRCHIARPFIFRITA